MASFNPRTRVGCDVIVFVVIIDSRAFQSTHPCGVRQSAPQRKFVLSGFNPRTRVGCDFKEMRDKLVEDEIATVEDVEQAQAEIEAYSNDSVMSALSASNGG